MNFSSPTLQHVKKNIYIWIRTKHSTHLCIQTFWSLLPPFEHLFKHLFEHRIPGLPKCHVGNQLAMRCRLLETNLVGKKNHREVMVGKPLGWGPVNNNPHIHLKKSESLLGPISPFKGLLGELFASQGTKIHPVVFFSFDPSFRCSPPKKRGDSEGITPPGCVFLPSVFCDVFIWFCWSLEPG